MAWAGKSRNWRGSSRETRCEDIPEWVRAHARLVLLDTLGVILAGSERPEVAALRERLGAGAGSGATVYARGWPRSDPRTAALLNGVAGRADRAMRRAAARIRAGGDAGAARGARGRRAGGKHRARHAGGVHCRLRCRRDGLPAGLRRARWRIRTGRCPCSPRRLPERNCAASTPPESAVRCASRRRCC